MSVHAGEMYTVTAHTPPWGLRCGDGWHCRVVGTEYDGKVTVQQIGVDGQQWRNRMSTLIFVSALRPLEVQVDLFGNPTPPPAPPRAAR